jgi:NAD(P)-dependent dehydrogenase (short-subunit alcohol dehydrogenase family)
VRREQNPDLTGRVVVVTGANSGIGKETAADLAAMGATVVMTARTRSKGEVAVDEVRARTGSDRVEVGDLDLSSFASIRSFAAWLLDRHDRLDVLVANAGVITDVRRETAEGFEEMFGVNHVGHFLLTSLLEDRLVATAPARVVVVSSLAHRLAVGGLDRDCFHRRERFRTFRAYAESKLANVQFTVELARRLAGSGVTVNCVHPGTVASSFGADGDTGALDWLIRTSGRHVMRSPSSGARTPVLLASSTAPRVAEVTGGYFSHGRRWRPSRAALDVEACRWLWDETQRHVDAAP